VGEALTMATVRKRRWGDGKTAWVADYFDQHRKRHTKTFATQRKAKEYLTTALHEIKHGTHTPESGSITVAEAADIWLQRCALENLERSTLNQYRGHVRNHIKPSRIGDQKLARLSTPMIQAFRDQLLAGGTRVMARKVLISLKSIIGEAQRRGLVAQNVAQPVKIDVKKRDQQKLEVGRDIPSKEEVQALLGAVDDRRRPFLITAVFTGMRASELRGMPSTSSVK
jgi:integrase